MSGNHHFHNYFPYCPAAQTENFFFLEVFQPLLPYQFQSQFFFFFLQTVAAQSVNIFSAHIHIAEFIEHPPALIGN